MTCGLALALVLVSGSARAGGGAENLFLLVNATSESSKTIANHYLALRQIPPTNVLYLDWKGSREQTDIATFREQILQPALAAIDDRGLAEQIDYLVYSSDFPWSIDARGDYSGGLPQWLTPVVSTNAATYLWQFTLAGQGLLDLNNNFYFQPLGDDLSPETVGFPRRFAVPSPDEAAEPARVRYLLSTMLAVTSGRGTTVEEAVAYLQRSAAADATQPEGTIYLLRNRNVRSTTRDWTFAQVADELQALGVRARVIEGELPLRKVQVQGLTIGTSDFDWPGSQSTLAPGALCDNLTSHGGDLRKGASQTPLSAFLRHGAAGACGTVTEPYAIKEKFPTPAVHLHYARGCSLAEAFYQSVAGPFQLLLVGDPLCQPWSRPPQVLLPDLKPGQVVHGQLVLKAEVEPQPDQEIARLELFVDGRRVAQWKPPAPVVLDTHELSDGFHELRLVAIEASPIACQGRLVVPITVDNLGRQAELRIHAPQPVPLAGQIKLTMASPGAKAIALLHNGRVLGQIEGEQGELVLPAHLLGRGPITLQAATVEENPVWSPPVQLEVK